MKISGTILDSNNEPLHLANITILNGNFANKLGTIANDNGCFELENDSITPESIFKISYQGLIPQNFSADELDDKKIILLETTETQSVFTKKEKPMRVAKTTQPSNITEHFIKHKNLLAGIGGIVGLILILSYFKKRK